MSGGPVRWNPLTRLTLRQMLTLPYIALVLGLAAAIGGLSWHAGRQALDNLSDQLLTETVNRIAQAVDRHVSGSQAVLETAFPKGVAAPGRLADALPALRTRFWLATTVHRDPNNYAYYGDVDGQFFGLWRFSEDEAELRLRLQGQGPRTLARFTGIAGELRELQPEPRVFEPRERPWFKVGQGSEQHSWTAVYIDFRTLELVATRARRVPDAQGQFRGVVATDLSLQRVNDFLRGLKLSANGLAFIVEPGGNLIGVSRGDHLRTGADGKPDRLQAEQHADALVVATYRAYRNLLQQHSATLPRTDVISGPDGRPVQVAHARISDGAGLDWVILVAVPRRDFLGRVDDLFRDSALVGGLAVLAVLLIGAGVLAVVTRDLAGLVRVTEGVAAGQEVDTTAVQRHDEIGALARSVAAMQHQLMHDRLTGLLNREAMRRQIDARLLRAEAASDAPAPFALLFIDLDRFKRINDSLGHDVGDRVLCEVAQRLRAALQPADQVARYAGDEFLVLLDGVADAHGAEQRALALQQQLARPLEALAGSDDPHCGASIGIARFPADGADVDGLLQRADEDMYRRKPGADRR